MDLLCAGPCGDTKDSSQFYKRSDRPRGFFYQCKDCCKDYTYSWREENPDKIKTHEQSFRARHPERLEKDRLARIARDPDYYNRYRRTHLTEHAQVEQTRRARKLDQFVEHVDHRIVYERDNETCGICGEHVEWADFSLDHVIPLSKGGEHSYANTQTAHLPCNIRKGAKIDRMCLKS